jgi:hypothetical protein
MVVGMIASIRHIKFTHFRQIALTGRFNHGPMIIGDVLNARKMNGKSKAPASMRGPLQVQQEYPFEV